MDSIDGLHAEVNKQVRELEKYQGIIETTGHEITAHGVALCIRLLWAILQELRRR